jgi:hypothetical protein
MAIDRGVDVELNRPKSWKEFQTVCRQAALSKLECTTIGVDTIDFLVNRYLWPTYQDAKEKINFDGWRIGGNRQMAAFYDLAEATDKYNVVATCHLKDVYQKEGDSPVLQKVGLGLTGGFKDSCEALFDNVWLCVQGTKTTVVDGKAAKTKVWRYHTVAPDRYHYCKSIEGLPNVIEIEEGGSLYAAIQECLGK